MDLCKPSDISGLLQRHGFSFSKGLGQNFIINPSVCPAMAEQCGASGRDGVLEIGPGIGVLTKELALRCRKVAAVELDRRLFPLLEETLGGFENVSLIYGDILKTDLHALINNEFSRCENVFVCANLPYYITSPVIMRLLEDNIPFNAVTVMVQKEAADRLCAPVGSRAAGAVTVAVRYYSEPEFLFPVSRGSFMPSPKVDSAVIKLNLRQDRDMSPEEEKIFFAAVHAGFGQRRKTLLNALTAAGFPKSSAAAAISSAGLSETVRGEALSMDDWQDLSRRLAELCSV